MTIVRSIVKFSRRKITTTEQKLCIPSVMSPSVINWFLFLTFNAIHGQNVLNNTPPVPTTTFSCRGRNTGFYADVNMNCLVYYMCDNHGNKFTYECPQDTAFQQDSLVCDHAYRVDCRKSAELISDTADSNGNTSSKSDEIQDSETFSRSFRIAPQPSIILLAPKSDNQQPTTFTMSSTMFFKGQLNSQSGNREPKSQKLIEQKLLPPSTTSATSIFKSSQSNFPFKNQGKNSEILEKPRNAFFEKNSSAEVSRNNGKIVNSKPLFVNNNIYPYTETLRSIQNNLKKNNTLSTAFIAATLSTTTAGTEFPIPKFDEALFGSNVDDPYYPRYSSTEKYYSLSTKNKQQKFFAFTTARPLTINAAAFEIPDSLPDLNSVEDLVDRRKLLFIPRVKNI